MKSNIGQGTKALVQLRQSSRGTFSGYKIIIVFGFMDYLNRS